MAIKMPRNQKRKWNRPIISTDIVQDDMQEQILQIRSRLETINQMQTLNEILKDPNFTKQIKDERKRIQELIDKVSTQYGVSVFDIMAKIGGELLKNQLLDAREKENARQGTDSEENLFKGFGKTNAGGGDEGLFDVVDENKVLEAKNALPNAEVELHNYAENQAYRQPWEVSNASFTNRQKNEMYKSFTNRQQLGSNYTDLQKAYIQRENAQGQNQSLMKYEKERYDESMAYEQSQYQRNQALYNAAQIPLSQLGAFTNREAIQRYRGAKQFRESAEIHKEEIQNLKDTFNLKSIQSAYRHYEANKEFQAKEQQIMARSYSKPARDQHKARDRDVQTDEPYAWRPSQRDYEFERQQQEQQEILDEEYQLAENDKPSTLLKKYLFGKYPQLAPKVAPKKQLYIKKSQISYDTPKGNAPVKVAAIAKQKKQKVQQVVQQRLDLPLEEIKEEVVNQEDVNNQEHRLVAPILIQQPVVPQDLARQPRIKQGSQSSESPLSHPSQFLSQSEWEAQMSEESKKEKFESPGKKFGQESDIPDFIITAKAQQKKVYLDQIGQEFAKLGIGFDAFMVGKKLRYGFGKDRANQEKIQANKEKINIIMKVYKKTLIDTGLLPAGVFKNLYQK